MTRERTDPRKRAGRERGRGHRSRSLPPATDQVHRSSAVVHRCRIRSIRSLTEAPHSPHDGVERVLVVAHGVRGGVAVDRVCRSARSDPGPGSDAARPAAVGDGHLRRAAGAAPAGGRRHWPTTSTCPCTPMAPRSSASCGCRPARRSTRPRSLGRPGRRVLHQELLRPQRRRRSEPRDPPDRDPVPGQATRRTRSVDLRLERRIRPTQSCPAATSTCRCAGSMAMASCATRAFTSRAPRSVRTATTTATSGSGPGRSSIPESTATARPTRSAT